VDPLGKALASAPFDVFPAEPDLIASELVAPSAAKVGGAISLQATILNSGSATATNVAYAYYVSSSKTVSSTDLQVGGGTISCLAPGATFTHTDQATLPATLPTGSYTVGLIVDPANLSPESSRASDRVIAPQPLMVATGALAVTTTAPPAAAVGAPYETRLSANGGDGRYAWSLAQGALPHGLALDANGQIQGTPSTAGDSPLTVEVKDGSGLSATMPLDFKVNALGLPLSVLTAALPAGSFGLLYSLALSAEGGTPPYQWTLVAGEGTLPPGIALSADGTLAGNPAADGAFVFEVQVQDSTKALAHSPPLDLEVVSPGQVSVAGSQLPAAQLGKLYQAQAQAVGGVPPYQWQLLDDQRLPSGPGDPGSDLAAAMPGGLSLDPSGEISGTPTLVGQFNLSVLVTDSSSPPATVKDSVLLTILAGQALSITNSTVPEGTVGVPYQVTLDTNATGEQVTFVVVDGAAQDSPAARQTLPPGLALAPGGILSGRPTTTGTFDFLVRATDAEDRVALQALSLSIVPGAPKGCGTAPGGGSPVAWAGLLFWAAIRRRS
jgi:hypothetical protein